MKSGLENRRVFPIGVKDMTYSKRSSVPAKLIGLTAVVAGVVFSSQEHCELACLDESSSDSVVVYPVDRNDLSQSILPLDASEVTFQMPATEPLTLDAIAATSSLSEADEKGPSAYEIKLADQQAWGSRQRQVDLASQEKRSITSPVGTAALEVTQLNNLSDAQSDLPLVPGIEDPHSFYDDAAASNLAFSAGQESVGDANLPIELAEGSFDFSAPIEVTLLPSLPKSKPAFVDPVALEQAAKIAAPVMRTARAWETGRY